MQQATPPRRRLRRPADFKHRYGPWALVTGASDGIGKQSAELLAAAGLNIVAVARRADRLHDLTNHLRATYGVEATAVDVDLSRPGALLRLFDETSILDVGLLVAAAGFGTTGPFLRNPVDTELDMLTVNCAAVTSAAHHFGQWFAQRGSGGIVLFSSIVAFQGVANTSTYAATKAYIQSFAEGIRPELAPLGVHVLASAPGPVSTGFGARADMHMGSATKADVVAAKTLNALGRRALVRPGARSKVLALALATAPRRLRTVILTKIIGGFTAHQLEVTGRP